VTWVVGVIIVRDVLAFHFMPLAVSTRAFCVSICPLVLVKPVTLVKLVKPVKLVKLGKLVKLVKIVTLVKPVKVVKLVNAAPRLRVGDAGVVIEGQVRVVEGVAVEELPRAHVAAFPALEELLYDV
jgi:hypothetical protein